MKSPWIKHYIVIGAIVFAGLFVVEWSWAQEPANDQLSEADEPAFRTDYDQLEHAKRAVAESKLAAAHAKRIARAHAGPDAVSAIRQAAEGLRDAEGDDAKADAEAKLRELLSNYFDEDMSRRVSELEDLEKRVRQLRAQLERRGDHKPDIIDLQVKVLINEAEGLGFFNNTAQSGFIFGPPGGDQFNITGPAWHLPPTHPRVTVPGWAPTPPAAPQRAAAPARESVGPTNDSAPAARARAPEPGSDTAPRPGNEITR